MRAFRIFRLAGKVQQLRRIVDAVSTSVIPMANAFFVSDILVTYERVLEPLLLLFLMHNVSIRNSFDRIMCLSEAHLIACIELQIGVVMTAIFSILGTELYKARDAKHFGTFSRTFNTVSTLSLLSVEKRYEKGI